MNKTENELMHKAVERCIEKGKGNGSLYSLYSKGFGRGFKTGKKELKTQIIKAITKGLAAKDMEYNILKYKGYTTKIEYDPKDKLLYGKIEGISDLVDFSSESATLIEKEFQEAVDGYLEICEEVGKEPERGANVIFNTGRKKDTR